MEHDPYEKYATNEQVKFMHSLAKQLKRKGAHFQFDKDPKDQTSVEASDTIEKMLDLKDKL